MAYYKKLVRDHIPRLLKEKGISYKQSTADDETFKTVLIQKLEEEVQEFLESPSPEELADILEVVQTLQLLSDFCDAEKIRIYKKQEKGGFDQRIICEGDDGR